MKLHLKYPTQRSSRSQVATHPTEIRPLIGNPLLEAMNTPSSWRTSTTDREISDAIFAHCRRSREQLNEVLAST